MGADGGLALLENLDQVPDAQFRAWFVALPADSQRRAAAFRSARRWRQFVGARQLLTSLVAWQLDIAAVIRERPGEAPGIDGAGFYCSLSHSADAVMVGWSASAPVGVDIECRRARGFGKLVTAWFHPREQNHFFSLPSTERSIWFYRQWTVKEAAAKATGGGLSQAMLREPAPLSDGSRTVNEFVFESYCAAVVHHSPVALPLWRARPAENGIGLVFGASIPRANGPKQR